MSLNDYKAPVAVTVVHSQEEDDLCEHLPGDPVKGVLAHDLTVETVGTGPDSWLRIKTGCWTLTYEEIDVFAAELKRIIGTVRGPQ